MTRIIKKIWNWISGALVGVVVLLAVALVGVRLIGLQPFVVLSGSMWPTYEVGSLIYVKSVDCKELEVGDPITFMVNQDTIVTHRIAGIVPDDTDPDTLWFRTKGDANDTEDAALVHYRNVIGRAVFSIPYLGYLSHYIQNPPGLYVALGCGAVLLIAAFWPTTKKKEQDPQETG